MTLDYTCRIALDGRGFGSKHPRILFVTSSFRTRWEIYSQALVRASSLASQVLLLDGRAGWHPLNFVEKALAYESDFIVHIDEDCFLLDPGQLIALVSDLAIEPDLAAAGVPDGGTPYRGHNPYACNLYFCVIKTAALRQAVAGCPEWRALRFNPAWAVTPGPVPVLEAPERVTLDDFEPYYPLFWLLLDQGYRIQYLTSRLNPVLMASEVFLGTSPQPMVIHAWHLRQWFSKEIDPFLGISPSEKYRRLRSFLNRTVARRPSAYSHMLSAAGRLFRDRMLGRG